MSSVNLLSIREDWPTWLVALAFAVALHTYVSQTEPIEVQTRAVPLVISQSSSVAVANALPPEVNMRIEGPKDFVKEYLDTQPVAHLNLENASEGMGQELRFFARPEPALNQVRVTFDPPGHLVDLEPRLTETFIPRLQPRGELSDNLTMSGAPEGIPERVTVTGAARLVREVVEVVYQVDLSRFEGVTQQDVSFIALDDAGVRIPFLQITPPSAPARFPISRKQESIRVPVIPQLEGGPAPGWMITEIAVDPVAVEIAGPGRELAKLRRLETESIDIAGIASDQTYTARVTIPRNVGIEATPRSVTVRLTLAQQTSLRTFSGIPVALNDQMPDYVYRLNPAELQITVRGTARALEDMLEGTIRGAVRVASFPVGEHQIRTDAISLTLPAGITVASRTPESFTLTVAPAQASPPADPD